MEISHLQNFVSFTYHSPLIWAQTYHTIWPRENNWPFCKKNNFCSGRLYYMENAINGLRMCIHNYIQRVVLNPCITELLHVSFHKHSVWFWVSKLLLMVLDIFLWGNYLILEQTQRLMVALLNAYSYDYIRSFNIFQIFCCLTFTK